jgi:L-ascorbate metabolism protein UlaG (beta-lactamase superfamily)
LSFGDLTLYIDPYLSESVAEQFGEHLRRQVPPPLAPNEVKDADWVLITHEHLDHLDPKTLEGISRASAGCRVICPAAWVESVIACGFPRDRVQVVSEDWLPLNSEVSVRAVPAAHPHVERDANGHLLRVGYVLRFPGVTVYHAGDTSPDDAILAALRSCGPVDIALLPINERNFYRDREGILGNMSVREAMAFATELGVGLLVPIHWDLFAPNSVLPEEVTLLHRALNPPFALAFAPSHLALG